MFLESDLSIAQDLICVLSTLSLHIMSSSI